MISFLLLGKLEGTIRVEIENSPIQTVAKSGFVRRRRVYVMAIYLFYYLKRIKSYFKWLKCLIRNYYNYEDFDAIN